MRSTIRPSARPSRLRNQRGLRLISLHLTLCLVLLSLGAAVVLSSVLVDARSESRRTATRSGQKQDTKPGNTQSDPGGPQQQNPSDIEQTAQARSEEDRGSRKPKEERLTKAHSFNGDLRDLPYRKPVKRERPEREEPEPHPTLYPGTSATTTPVAPSASSVAAPSAPAPATLANFDGLDFATFGAGHPPDTNGDVGPTYYIQTVNTSIGIFRKSDGVRVAAFTFNTFMSQGNFGNLCDTNNFGDPVVLYDSFEDRWIITDFAFTLDGSNNVINPPGSFQCIAASKTGDPVSGGWNFYSINTTGGYGDYPKFGIWPDGLYMSVNMFDYAAGGDFQNARVYAFNKAQMYAGAPAVQSVSFDAPADDFTILPSNARLQTGTPPPGSPNYFVSTWQFLNALTVYKFHVDWNRISASTFTGPDVPLAATSWPNSGVPNAPSLGGNSLEVLEIRAMMQNQYSNIGGAESLWTTHTVRRGNTTGFAAPRWYQVDVSSGNVATNLPQAATWDPDGANVIHRFMPSLAVDRIGNMALGYSTSSSTTKPAIKYAGRLATDPINTLSQTEQVLIQGTGTQTGNCGGTCTRWGDYSAMSLDPDGCTFWYTNEYYAVDGLNDLTRIGSFAFPQCTPVGTGGTVSGTVTDSATSNPISGASVALGSRTTTTNSSGVYTFSNLPAGTYPGMTASFAGYGSSTATSIVVADAATTTQNFSLTTVSISACSVDTSQADFQTGVLTNANLTSSPGDVTLSNNSTIDQQNTTLGTQGAGFNTTTWLGQTFTAAITGPVTRVDINFFSLNCASVTMPNLTVSIRAASANLPTGADLASATILGFCNGGGGFFTATFATPVILTAGTQYALVWRAAAAIPAGAPAPGYFGTVSADTGAISLQNPYAGGRRASSSNSGASWAGASGNANNDHGFKVYVNTGYSASGNLVSGVKDANPAGGFIPHWLTLSWTATTPANTAVQFQAAASNSINGPFNFVGPDGTAATFFTTIGASLSQFNGFRYLKYKALLSTSNSTMTPILNDVTVCFDNDTPAITAAAPLSRQQGSAPINSQIATVSDSGQAANTLTVTAAPLTGTGITINNIGIDVAGNVTADVGASCTATNSTFTLTVTNSGSATATATLTVNVTSTATPTITPGGPTTFCSGGIVSLTSSSANGNQWYLNGSPIGGATNQAYIATATGNYTVTVTANGCTTAPSAATSVTVDPIPATPTITPGGPTTFCNGGSVTLTSSSPSGNQWYLEGNPIGGATNQAYIATATGNYTVTVTANGCTTAPSAATSVTVDPIPATPTITPGGPTTFCNGGSVTLTSSSPSGNQWYLNGNPIGGATNQQYIATAAGAYTNTVTTSNCSSAPATPTTVTVNPIPATPTITPGGPTTFLVGGSVTLTSGSGSGNQWYLNGNPIGGATAQQYIATASGDYTVIVTSIGCNSAPSAATTVSVNLFPPTTTKAFNPINIAPNGISTLSITITNPAVNTAQLNGVAFTDNFPANLVVANPDGLINTCGGAVTAAVGSGSVSLTGGTIAINSFCTVSVNVTSSVVGSYLNSTGMVSSTNGGIGNSASATLGVAFPPTISKLFLPDRVTPNGTTLLSFTISNPNSDPNTNVTLTGIAFADNLPVGLVIASPNELSNDCGGTVTATPGSSSISLIGGTLAPADPALLPGQSKNQASENLAQGACFITVKVKAPSDLGTLNNTTGPITSNESGPGATSNTASLTVTPPPVPPTIAKGFGTASIPLNGTTTLTFLLTNPNANVMLMNIAASDTLPAGLVVASANSLAGSCEADIIAEPGTNMIGITALNLPASSSCSFSVDVTGTSAGIKNNITGNVTATYDDGTGDFARIIGGVAAATIDVLKGNQTITFDALTNKTFGDADFIVGATASSGLPVSVTAAGNCTISGALPTVHLTGAGSCTITSSQGGNSNYNSATNVVHSFNISQAATTTVLSSSVNPSDIGQNVIFTAVVTPPSNTSTPSGTVQFKDGLNNLGGAVPCIASLANTCTAQVSTATFTSGAHAISATYSADTNFVGSSGSLSGGQVVTNQLALLLILEEIGPNPNQASALDSLLLLRDPFPVHSIAEWFNFGPDRNTRVMVFVANLQLNPGETNSAVVVNLIDSNNQNYDVPAEDVRLDLITGFAQVTFRLPDTLFPGACTVQVKAHGHVSNSALIRIGP